jgi:chromosome segregation ATPase
MKSVILAASLASATAYVEADSVHHAANPIRKVVNMLQNMQKKVEAEGEKEKELFDKFMCYCKNAGGDLSKSISDAGTAIPELGSNIEEAESQLAQTKEDVKQAQTDRAAAKMAMNEATAIREKEAAAYASVSSDLKANIGAMTKAIAAIDKGAGGAFLQTASAKVLQKLVLSDEDMVDYDRQTLTGFLSGSTEDANVAQITGILKQMKDTMSKNLAETTSTENAAKSTYEELMSAKTREVEALTAAIEEKIKRIGDLGVSIVQMKNDLSDTQEALLEDKKFLAGLDENCAKKEKEWAIIVKSRSEELLALADTIKILNDDDALEMFKKTLPGASASFVQIRSTEKSMKSQALQILDGVRKERTSDRQKIDYVMLAIRGKAPGFEKVIKLIDNMVDLLKQEQVDDDSKKEYCEMQFDAMDDKKKGLEREESQYQKSIEDAKEDIATLTSEIEALGEGIKALDKSVKEATEQRMEENDDYKTLMASDAAAKDILGFAKNRLNKFYNPKLYKPEGANFMQISAHRSAADPGPPPEAPGAFKKKSEESGGVIAMIDLLIKDLDKEMTEAEFEEKDAQSEYEEMMSDSSQKRTADTRSIAQKTETKADLEQQLSADSVSLKDTQKELMATHEYISSLHGECDWLLKYFDMRKEARSGEIDALGKAKAVLSGADFSLVQTKAKKFLSQ